MMNNKPKALILASVASMIEQFNMQNIELLLENGYEVHVACNCREGSTISDAKIQQLTHTLTAKGVTVVHVPIPRKITNIRGILDSLAQVKTLCNTHAYALLHCHSPIGSVVARVAAVASRRKGTKVIYTAHGFHFYKGAPKANWILYYPIEKLCSRWTDVLITINREDYAFAQKHMRAGQVVYIPGVGLDTAKFSSVPTDCEAKRTELGLQKNDILLLSVGELNQNKNHETIIRALAQPNIPPVHYVIAGEGDRKQELAELASALGVNLHLLGYRTDVTEWLHCADAFVLPSFREGLSVALMEAMAAGLPCIVSAIRGNVDLIDATGGFLCEPEDIQAFASAIAELFKDDKRRQMGARNQTVIKDFDVHTIMNMTAAVYGIDSRSTITLG